MNEYLKHPEEDGKNLTSVTLENNVLIRYPKATDKKNFMGKL
jgi:hypothetical protein